MKKRFLAVVLALTVLLAINVTAILGDPGGSGSRPPIELTPTSTPIPFPYYEADNYE